MVGIILDVILIAIIALNIFIGYKKGLVKLAVGLIAVLASIIIAMLLYKPVSNVIIENTEIDENIKSTIISNFTKDTESEVEDTSTEKTDDGFMKYIEKYVDDTVNKTKNEIVIEASEVISVKVINVCVFIGIFIIARLLMILLTFIADIIMSLPILKQFNEIGGILYGAVKALLIIYIILAIMFFIVYITGNSAISDAITSSYITKLFYNNNLLLNIIF